MQALQSRQHGRAPMVAYHISIDRAGLALGAGGLLGGMVSAVLVAMGERADFASVAFGLSLGALFTMVGIVVVAGPIWLAFHAAGRRRAHHAAIAGAMAGLLVFAGGQSHGFGLFGGPGDGAGIRWLNAVLTGGAMMMLAGLIGLAMWRIAYRRAR